MLVSQSRRKLHRVMVSVSDECLLSLVRWQGIKIAVKTGNKELPASLSHYPLASPRNNLNSTKETALHESKSFTLSVCGRQSPATESIIRVCGHSTLTQWKLSCIKGDLKIPFPFLCFFSSAYFLLAHHHILSAAVLSVINLHQIRLL